MALETELDGDGMSFASANAGEIWIVPADAKYASRAPAEYIACGELFLDSVLFP